ncbi:MAG: hypothetical protein H0S79_10120 [Anaerolineaceae bacterium]|nr:hypothetical protein [Anaerolineaceae bacterium]
MANFENKIDYPLDLVFLLALVILSVSPDYFVDDEDNPLFLLNLHLDKVVAFAHFKYFVVVSTLLRVRKLVEGFFYCILSDVGNSYFYQNNQERIKKNLFTLLCGMKANDMNVIYPQNFLLNPILLYN